MQRTPPLPRLSTWPLPTARRVSSSKRSSLALNVRVASTRPSVFWCSRPVCWPCSHRPDFLTHASSVCRGPASATGRAKSWQAFAGVEGLDPNLTSSGQIGMRVPVINVGWGVSISLTVSASSLLAWTEHEARCAAIDEADAVATEVGAAVAAQTVQGSLVSEPSPEPDATEVD